MFVAIMETGSFTAAAARFGSIHAPHGTAGFFCSNEGGGREFPKFRAIALVVQALPEAGAYVVKRACA